MPLAISGIVSPQEWLKRTSVLFGARSAALRKADAAYNKYYNFPSDENKKELYGALYEYLKGKGGNWEKVDRDKNSGGLMRDIYNKCKPHTSSNILEKRVPDARHGVLYLWQHAQVQTHWAKIALEGALGVGSATTSVLQTSSYTSADKLQLGLNAQSSKVNASAAVLGSANVARRVALAPKGTADPVILMPRRPYINLYELGPNPSLWERAKRYFGTKFSELCDFLGRKIAEIWDDLQRKWQGGRIAAPAGAAITGLVNFIVGEVASHAAPFVASGTSIVQGFAKAFSAAKDRISAAWQKRLFIIPPGHPQLIGNAIETQMNWEIGKGLYSLAKGAVLLTTDVLTLGASALVNVIAACVELAYKVITRYSQASKMNDWVQRVKAATRDRRDWKKDPLDAKLRPAIVFDDRKFNDLFEDGCNASVCIPMMTLNSGIAGDLMMFVKIFDDTGTILGQRAADSGPSAEAQKKFDAGHAYWSLLKERGRDYLASTGFQFKSADNLVQSLMQHAIRDHQRVVTFTDKALAFGAGSLAA